VPINRPLTLTQALAIDFILIVKKVSCLRNFYKAFGRLRSLKESIFFEKCSFKDAESRVSSPKEGQKAIFLRFQAIFKIENG
jgi:hypothetical protein